MRSVYPSQVDRWLVVTMAIAPIAMVIMLIAGLASGHAPIVWFSLGATVFLLLLFRALIYPMEYILTDQGLEIRAGWIIRLAIPWGRLQGGMLSNNPLSSPALSLRRIRLDYQKGNGKTSYVLISPQDRLAFLRDVAEASPLHRYQDEQLLVDEDAVDGP